MGRLVAPGGKVEVGETVRQAAVREVNEEVALKLVENSLSHVGDLTYLFPTKPAWNQRSSVFLASHPGGDPVESDELAPEWFPVEALPLEEMWDDASYWLRRAIGGTFVRATFVFNPDLKTVASTDYRER